MNLNNLNAQSVDGFTNILGTIFEHSPWVAEAVLNARPFETVEQLHQTMCKAVDCASVELQIALIKAHPDLAGKAALSGELTEESTKEQAGAGLDRLSGEEFANFNRLNDSYQAKFGFPFIIAVKGHDKHSILDAFDARLKNNEAQEKAEALKQIYRIAKFRLNDLLEI